MVNMHVGWQFYPIHSIYFKSLTDHTATQCMHLHHQSIFSDLYSLVSQQSIDIYPLKHN